MAAEFSDIPAGVLTAGTALFGAIAAALGFLWKGKQKDVDDLRVELRRMQDKYEDLLLKMVTSEPARKEALDNAVKAIADNTALLREMSKKWPTP